MPCNPSAACLQRLSVERQTETACLFEFQLYFSQRHFPAVHIGVPTRPYLPGSTPWLRLIRASRGAPELSLTHCSLPEVSSGLDLQQLSRCRPPESAVRGAAPLRPRRVPQRPRRAPGGSACQPHQSGIDKYTHQTRSPPLCLFLIYYSYTFVLLSGICDIARKSGLKWKTMKKIECSAIALPLPHFPF